MTTAAHAPTSERWQYWTEPSFVSIDGIETAYRRSGSGETNIFLHGAHFSRVWLPFYEELANEVDLIVPELPGFGETEYPAHFRSLSDYRLHLEALTRTLASGPVHLIGHALGGWLAADFAVNYPDRVKSLTLITPEGVRVETENRVDPFRLFEEELRAAYFNGREDAFVGLFEQEDPTEVAVRRSLEGRPHAAIAWNPRNDYRFDHRLARVTAPALVLGVEDYRYARPEAVARYAELLPNSNTAIITGEEHPSAHMAIIEQPTTVAKLVLDHVRAASAQ